MSQTTGEIGIVVERLEIDGGIELYTEADTWFIQSGDTTDAGTLTLFGPRLDGDTSKRRPIAVFSPNTWATVRPAGTDIQYLERV